MAKAFCVHFQGLPVQPAPLQQAQHLTADTGPEPANREESPLGAAAHTQLAQPAARASELPGPSPPMLHDPSSMAYVAALGHRMGIDPSILAQQMQVPWAEGSQERPPVLGMDEQELATRQFAEDLQDQQQPAAAGPITSHPQSLQQRPPVERTDRERDGAGHARLPLVPHADRWRALPPRQHPLGDAPEDRFPHNPALDPFLSSLHQSHRLMQSQAASQRHAARHDTHPGPSPGHDARPPGQAYYNEALRMDLDSPLYASNQAAAAAAAAVEAAAAAAAGGKELRAPPAFISGGPRGMMAPDNAFRPGEGSQPARLNSGYGYWPHPHGSTDAIRTGYRCPADAAMEAAMHAQLLERARVEADLEQQALLHAAAQREAQEGDQTPGIGADSCHARDSMFASQFPNRATDHVASFRGHMHAHHAQDSQATGAYEPADHHDECEDDHEQTHPAMSLPAGHPLESFIEQERARAGMNRPDPDRLSMDILRSAIARSSGASEPRQSWNMQQEQSPHMELQALRAAASQGDSLMQGLSRPGIAATSRLLYKDCSMQFAPGDQSHISMLSPLIAAHHIWTHLKYTLHSREQQTFCRPFVCVFNSRLCHLP